jgi:hypothetical protein
VEGQHFLMSRRPNRGGNRGTLSANLRTAAASHRPSSKPSLHHARSEPGASYECWVREHRHHCERGAMYDLDLYALDLY